MDSESRRDLELLEALTQNDRISQRSLASKLGVALGLANIYLKRLARKGHIKCISIPSNRLRYLITPQGIAEKTRLTYEFMDHSLQLYRGARRQLRAVLEPLASEGHHRIAIFGTGEAAELAYLSLKEFGLDPVVVLDDEGGRRFLGMTVAAVSAHRQFAFDILILATLEHPGPTIARLEALGIGVDKLVSLRALAPTAATPAAVRVRQGGASKPVNERSIRASVDTAR